MALEKITEFDIQDLITVMTDGVLTNEFSILIQDTLPSTNSFLFDLLSKTELPKHKTVVLAENQTAGKGREGRKWVSPPGNIYLSLYWHFDLTLDKLYALSLTVGIAIARVLKNNNLHDVKLKWPNDIFWNDRKMGGILIETKANPSGGIDTILGLGLNILDMDAYQEQISQKSVSLESALQHKVYRSKLVAQILVELNAVLTLFASRGFEAFVQEWNDYSMHEMQIN